MPAMMKCEESYLKIFFDCMVANGIEKTSMRNFSEASGLSISSIYYRFEDKDELIMETAYWGLGTIVKEIFWIAVLKIENYDELFSSVFKNIELRKNRLRLIYQLATSPMYGERFLKKSYHIADIYDAYIEMMAKRLKCSPKDVEPYVRLFIAATREYILWGDSALANQQFTFIYEALKNKFNFSGGKNV